MAWTYEFKPDSPESLGGVATVTYTDESVFKDAPFVYSHRLTLDGAKAVDDATRLKAEIEAACEKELARRTAISADSTTLATMLALKEVM